MLPKEEGTCFESIQRYYFDRTKGECTPLDYSGCGGNQNNFESLNTCIKFCHEIINTINDGNILIFIN